MTMPDEVRQRVVDYIKYQADTRSRAELEDLVRESQQRYLDAISGVDEKATAVSPGEGQWSLRELLRHVIAAERGVAAIVRSTAAGRETTSVKPGRAIGMQIADDGAPFSALLDQLRDTNADMLQAIRSLPDDADTETTFPHPWFGPLNCIEWAVFQRVHDTDHIQHAQKILAAI